MLRGAALVLARSAMEHLTVVHKGASETEETSEEWRDLLRAHSSCNSSWQDLGQARSNGGQAPPPPRDQEHCEQGEQKGVVQQLAWEGAEALPAWGVMVSARQKALASLNSAPATTGAASQAQLHLEHTASWLSGCRERPAFTLLRASSSEYACGRCA